MNRDRAVSALTVLRRRCSDERGFALVEAIAASAIFALIVLGVLAGIDGAAGSSGREKARSVAGTLAEQDQERMRGMRAVDLSNYSWDRDVVFSGATYRVESDSDWIRDNTGGEVSCQSSSAQADYLRIRTTVTSTAVGKQTAPVRIDSLMAPPIGAVGANQGTLAVQVNNRDGVGAPSIPVTISNGTITLSELTNAVGCSVFSYIPVGSYDVNVRQPGWVTPTGVNDVHVSGTVSNGTTNVTTVPAYDVAGTVTLDLRTRYWDAEQAKVIEGPSRAFSFGLANNGIGTASNVRQFKPASGAVSTLMAIDLFPFKDSYGLFTGQCGSENPGLANGGAAQIVDRAGIHTTIVYQPALRIKVVNGSAPVMGANVVATLRSPTGCVATGDKIPGIRTDALHGLTTYSSLDTGDDRRGWVTRPAIAGIGFDPGIPYGSWDVCVDFGGKARTLTSHVNRTIAPTAPVTPVLIDMAGAPNGTCS